MIGVAGANYYARHGGQVFTTKDRDLFVPPDAPNLLSAWTASRESGYELWSADEPLGEPLDLWLAERVVSRRANTTATHPAGVTIDFTLEMKGFDFEKVCSERKIFRIGDVEIPVARLSHIVASKAKVDRPKDRLFLATWEEALRDLLKDED
ncbi:MAG TPA: hypothetical protein VGS96_04735 [Thermoanaerobaculia bacterium]|jgi:hypothetical protein|nr:hypothetical protein [Thermoanaerobaculia bacterium]